MESEKKITLIKGRALQIPDFYRISKTNFFNKIEMTSANFRGKALESHLNSKTIEKIITHFPEINLSWLITGKGNMLVSNETLNAANEPTNDYGHGERNEIKKLTQLIESKDDQLMKHLSRIKELEDHLSAVQELNDMLKEKLGDTGAKSKGA